MAGILRRKIQIKIPQLLSLDLSSILDKRGQGNESRRIVRIPVTLIIRASTRRCLEENNGMNFRLSSPRKKQTRTNVLSRIAIKSG